MTIIKRILHRDRKQAIKLIIALDNGEEMYYDLRTGTYMKQQ